MQPVYYPQPLPARSAVPRVVGILAIIFSVIGMSSSALFTWGPLEDLHRSHDPDTDFAIMWTYLWGGLSAVIFLLHLIGGVFAVGYRKIGLRLLTAYAVAAIVLVLVDLFILYIINPTGHRIKNNLTYPHTF